ncbi:30S ribosomal protein S4e [Candidatus Micrarchaeota archaeon]|nr:30S ribosomal protein S4e [Candidatus Micrarchaeota archaeon]
MASHGKKRHTKRLGAARVVHVSRKSNVWIKTTRPGGHAKQVSAPLVVFLRDLIKLAATHHEARHLLKNGQVLVDGKVVKDSGFPVGLMDVVSIKTSGAFLVLIKEGFLVAVPTKEQGYKLCKITGKTILRGGKIQLSLHDGKTLLVDKKEYSPGDTLKLSIPKVSIQGHLKLEKGSKCYVFRGRHAGTVGKLVEIHVFPGTTPSNARIVDQSGSEVVTLKDYLFVVDENFKV